MSSRSYLRRQERTARAREFRQVPWLIGNEIVHSICGIPGQEDIVTVCYKIITLRGLLGVAAAPLVRP
jgi:hypothetical protein